MATIAIVLFELELTSKILWH